MKRNAKALKGSVVLKSLFCLIASAVTAEATSPAIQSIALNGPNPQLTIFSDLGVSNQIQTTTDLTSGNWVVLTNLPVMQSPYSFMDTMSPPGPARFYRVMMMAATQPQIPTNMVLIPAGSFQMGDTFGEGFAWEVPVHTVYVSAFYIDAFETTKALWDQVMNWALNNGYSFDYPGAGKAPNHPVQSIDWYDMVKWCNARSEMEGRTPSYYLDAGLTQVYRSSAAAPYVNWYAGYRLPTEAEWEKADRGGASGYRFPWSDVDTIDETRANYYSAPGTYSYDVATTSGYNPAFVDGVLPYTSPVGSFPPNAYGLYDTAGNVWEWCWDWAANYTSDPQTDPRGPDTGTTRVGKGGNWNYYAEHCRDAYRYGNDPAYSASNIGFRCALPGP